MNKRNRHRAFTLIELVAACAIAAVLMAGVLTIVTAMTRDRQRVALANLADPQSQKMLLELLRRDLSCAADIQSGAGMLTLHTFSSLDTADNSPLDRPSIVQYQIMQEGGIQSLLRRQQFTDDPIAPPSSAIVAFGVHALGVQAMQLRSSRQAIVKVDFGDSARNIQQTIVLN